MSKQRHIIGRTVLELDTGQLADVWSLQEDVSRLFQQQGVSVMEHLFDQLVGDEEVIRLDRLEVDLGSIDRQFLADEFIQKLRDALSQILEDHLANRLVAATKTENIIRNGRITSDWEVLLYFLRYGRLPWWCPSGDWKAWFPRWSTVIETDTNWGQKLRKLLVSDRVIKQRLVEQLPESFRHQLILKLEPAWLAWGNLLTEARQLIQSLELDNSKFRYLERQAWLLLLTEISTDNSPSSPFPETWISKWLAQLVQTWRQSAGFKQSSTKEDFQQQTSVSLTEKSPPISEQSNRADFNQIAFQRLRDILTAFPNSEKELWLIVLDQISATQLLNIGENSTFQEQREELQQGSEFVSDNIESGVDKENITPRPKTDWEVLLYFLQYGRLPWGEVSENWQDWLTLWLEVIQSDTTWQQPLRELLITNRAVRQRLIDELPEAFRHQLILHLQPTWVNCHALLGGEDSIFQEQREELQQGSEFVCDNIESGVDTENIIPTPKTDWEVLLYFLQYGRFPWVEVSENWQDLLARWLEVMQSDTTWQQPLRELLISNRAARQRIVDDLPEAFRHQLILHLQPTWVNWYTLLAQAKHLMQSLKLSNNNFQELEKQAWLILLAEINTDNSSAREFPPTWTCKWLTQLLQTWRQSAGFKLSKTKAESQQQTPVSLTETSPSASKESNRADFNQIAFQRLRTILAAFPNDEEALWLTALEQISTASSRNIGETSIPQEQREELQQGSEFVSDDIKSGADTENITPTPKTDWEVLLYFLQYGRLPRGEGYEDLQYWLTRWLEMNQSDTAWRQPLRELLITNRAVRQRLVEELPEAFRHQLILQLQPTWINWHALLAQAKQLMQSLKLSNNNFQELEKQAWLLLFAEISTDNAPTRPFPETWVFKWLVQIVQTWGQSAAFKELLTEAEFQQQSSIALTKTSPPVQGGESKQDKSSNSQESTNQNDRQRLHNIIAGLPIVRSSLWLNALEQVLTTTSADTITPKEFAAPRRATNSTLSPEEETAGLYVNQAGLVLLHPFLRFYFEAVGLCSGDSFQDESTQQMAIYLLHYLATKQTNVPEYELVLPKLLCGWSLNEPVVQVDLPDTALREGENLLQTAINYWDALKSTSPDGLREGFLQREGKLIRSGENNWKLQVEQQAIDVLLSQLPWGLSMVKLPWMEGLLIVEWN
ncbi:contractile injection system tape measure protein [Mastigocoleus sp. MO_188.B34]|uniref:contractile injection system tape measure protein n=1 Tax=Mastigocoleus sp. MO_188.B34 TaxID=3036635 RepID=UPI00260E3B77|nr:contractile injection system tape measure protein [Mastigocoleus sp. MO_188.B34]MDJ0697435.1 contractile injection system tape measure protein [Mastigocoleus sp. MO_188.B34]